MAWTTGICRKCRACAQWRFPRLTGNLLTQGFSSERFDLLAVDTSRFHRVAWFRSDFAAGQPLGELMRAIQPPPGLNEQRQPAELQISPAALTGGGGGILLPADATGLSLWANPGQPGARLAVGARLRDSTGYTFDAIIGQPGDPGWQKISEDIEPRRTRSNRPPPSVEPPFTLVNIQVFSRFGISDPGVLFLDDLSAITPDGEVLVEDFQSLANWRVAEDYTRPGLYALESSQAVSRGGGQQSAAYSWAPGGVSLRAIRPGPPDTPVAAIVSPQILELADIGVGDTIGIATSNLAFPIRVVAVADYFPTLDPRDQPFIVMDLQTLNFYNDRLGPPPRFRPQRGVGFRSQRICRKGGVDPFPGRYGPDGGGLADCHGGNTAAGGTAPGQCQLGRPAGPDVPGPGAGQRLRCGSFLLRRHRRTAHRVRPAAYPGHLRRATERYGVVQPAPDGDLRGGPGHLGLASRLAQPFFRCWKCPRVVSGSLRLWHFKPTGSPWPWPTWPWPQ